MTTPVPVEGGVDGGALLMSAGHRAPWAQEAERIGVPPPHHGVGPGGGEARDERDVAVEVLRGREAPAPAVDAEQGAGVGRSRRARGPREAIHVQVEASRSPGADDRRPGRIVHDRDGRRDRDGPATTRLMTQVRRGAGRKPKNVIRGARATRPVQVLGRCATRSAFDQESDRVGLVLLPGGEAWIAAGKGLDLGPVVRGNADAWPVASAHCLAKLAEQRLSLYECDRLCLSHGDLLSAGVPKPRPQVASKRSERSRK